MPSSSASTMSGGHQAGARLQLLAVLRGGGHLRHQHVELAGQRGQALVDLGPRRRLGPGHARWRPGPRPRRRSARSGASPCAPGPRRAGPSSRRRRSWCRSSAVIRPDATGVRSGAARGRRYPGGVAPSPELLGRLDPAASTYLQALRERVRHLRRRHGHEPAAPRARPRRLRRSRPRGLQRVARRDPPRPGRPGPPLLLRGRLRRGRDRHLRLDLGRPGRVRAGRPRPRADPDRAAELACAVARRVLDARAPPLGGGLHGPGHQVPDARADLVRRLPRRLRGAGARSARGRRRPPAHRDRSSTCSRSRPPSTAPGAPWWRSTATCRCRRR